MTLIRNKIVYSLRRLFLKLIRKSYYCPFCKKKVPFNPYGLTLRPKSECIKCGSLERHRIIYLLLRYKKLLNNKNIKILHIAAEKCFMQIFEKRFKDNYITGDLYNNSYKQIVDITNMKFKSNSFNLIICNHVLEHVQNDIDAYNEFNRVLAKNGVLIITVPIHGDFTYEDPNITTQSGRLKAFGQTDHVRIYGFDIVERINKAGFKVEAIRAKNFLSKNIMKKYSLDNLSQDIIFYCQKL